MLFSTGSKRNMSLSTQAKALPPLCTWVNSSGMHLTARAIFNYECARPLEFNLSKQKELHLKATKGMGLVDEDIPKAVKQTNRVPS